MSGFDASWLDLRESAEARARSPRVLARTVATLKPGRRDPKPNGLRIVDLGGGTGANLRRLAPLLGGRQHWLIVDDDAALLQAQPERFAAWAQSSGYELTVGSAVDGRRDRSTHAAPMRVRGPAFEAAIDVASLDLGTELAALDLPPRSLVTASALLDLVGDDWLGALIRTITDAEATAYFALSYDGRISLTPTAATDREVAGLVNAHQRLDKGFGPALGPEAAASAAQYCRAAGYSVELGDSDWQLDARDAGLQRALLDGWIAAALECAPHAHSRLTHWRARRHAQIARGELEIRVGHQDLLAHPVV